MEKKATRSILIIAYIILAIFGFAAILIIPATNVWFKTVTDAHPFIMGFFKFAILATAGELLAAKLSTKEWKIPTKVIYRFIIWGIIGVWITYMMKTFSLGVGDLMTKGIIINPSNAGLNRFLKALFTSATMNIAFGPTFMAFHKCTDKWLELKANGAKVSVPRIIKDVDWSKFVTFTLFKTVPIFWIPAHTITFMLPAEYQVIMAAFLSVALGIILSIKK
jgi:hypothetical protein